MYAPELGYYDLPFTGGYGIGVAERLLNEIEASPECARGLEPVIDFTGWRDNSPKGGPGKGQVFGSLILVIVGWMPRPPFFEPR